MCASPQQQSLTSAASAAAIPYWRAPWEFAVHTAVGTAIFAIIAGFAVLLNVGVHGLEAYHIEVGIIYGLKFAEYALFGADLYLFVVFLGRTVKRTMKDL